MTREPHGKMLKTQENITRTGEPRGQPFPAGDHKAARNRQDSLSNTNMKNK